MMSSRPPNLTSIIELAVSVKEGAVDESDPGVEKLRREERAALGECKREYMKSKKEDEATDSAPQSGKFGYALERSAKKGNTKELTDEEAHSISSGFREGYWWGASSIYSIPVASNILTLSDLGTVIVRVSLSFQRAALKGTGTAMNRAPQTFW